MAVTSGQVLTNVYSKSRFYVNWQQIGQDIGGNYTRINWQAGLSTGTSTSHDTFGTNAVKIYNVYINGTLVSNGGTWSNITSGGDTQLLSGTVDIPHNSDGTKAFEISISAWLYSNHNLNGNGSFELNQIPRYATITSFSVSKRDETSVVINWSADSVCDYAWYSINDNGWNALPSNNIISGLNPATAYNFRLRVRKQDSQLTSDSSLYLQSTYDYPYCISDNNFIIGQALTVSLYNPLSRNVSIDIIGIDNSVIASGSTNGTSLTGFNNSSQIDLQYKSMPNAQKGKYKVKVTYGSIVNTTDGGTYSVNSNVCSPTIDTITYKDTNSTTINITGNNQKIIRNQSKVQFDSAFTIKKYASAQSCKITINGSNHNMAINNSSSTINNVIIDSASDLRATVTLVDSRNLSVTKEVSINILDWVLPSGIITLRRHDNYYSYTDINVDANYSGIDGKNTINIKARYKKVSDTDFSEYITLQDKITSVINLDNNYAWDIQVAINDIFGTTTYNTSIQRGMPIIFYDRIKSSTGFNCFPKAEKGVEKNGMPLLTPDEIFPINKVELFFDADDHSNYLGLTWQLISKSLIPIGYNPDDEDFNVIGKTGGEKTHKLTIDEMPSHSHDYVRKSGDQNVFEQVHITTSDGDKINGIVGGGTQYGRSYFGISNTGGGQAHNNMPPYVVMAFWQRIA